MELKDLEQNILAIKNMNQNYLRIRKESEYYETSYFEKRKKDKI